MAQFVVRKLEDGVREKLKEFARTRGQSMEYLDREILRNAVIQRDIAPPRLGSRLAKRFSKEGLDHEIEEMRRQTLNPPSLNR